MRGFKIPCCVSALVEAPDEFSVQKEYKVYSKGTLILSGDKEYLMKIKSIIEEALHE